MYSFYGNRIIKYIRHMIIVVIPHACVRDKVMVCPSVVVIVVIVHRKKEYLYIFQI